jgi:2-polyprenyl-6-methoxyphenol hydroxylase-like FAD-dependent oxidoreductase
MAKHAVVIAGGGPTGMMVAAELALARARLNALRVNVRISGGQCSA